MALTFGFYDSINGDRTYNAEQFSRFFDGIISDGVIKAVGSKFQTTPGTNLAVKVGSGRAWFNHTWTYNDSDITVTLPAAHATLPRIDSIILSIDEQARTNTITYKQGTPASTPSAPALTNTETLHEYRIANVAIAATATSISSADITNVVGTNETPYATLSDMNVDYNTVANRPSINNIILTGNKTTAQLNLSYNDLTNKPALKTVATSGSYNDLSNQPSINGNALTGNKTSTQLGITYAGLNDKPSLNGKTFTGAMAWSPGARNSAKITVTHATVDWQWNVSADKGAVLRFTTNLPAVKNGMAIKKILISAYRGFDSGLESPAFGGSLSDTGITCQAAFAIITKSTNPISGNDSYLAEVYGGYYEANKTRESIFRQNHYYDYTSDMDTATDIEAVHALFGGWGDGSGGGDALAQGWYRRGSTPSKNADVRFGMVYWGNDNVLHYAMQEYAASTYIITTNDIHFDVVVLE